MTKIAVIGIVGESVFLKVDDFGKIGETIVAHDLHRELGGKGFNQALAAARCGAEVSFLAAVNEKDAEPYAKIADKCGIYAHFAGKKEKSPYAVISTDKSGDNKVCVYHGAVLETADVDAFAAKIAGSDGLLLNNEVPAAVNERAAEIARQYGVRIILNPAPARTLDAAFLDKIDLFTPNEHETAGLEAYDNVVVTLGKRGCLIKKTGETIPARKVEKVVDTTGAGDVFSGVLAACYFGGADLGTACRRASVASAIKVSRKYILDSVPTKKEIDAFIEKYGK